MHRANAKTGLRTRGWPLAVLVGASLLAGCGSSSDDEPRDDDAGSDSTADDLPGLTLRGFDGEGPGDLVAPWLVNARFYRVEEFTPANDNAGVGLLQYSDDFPVARHVEFFADELDTCELRRRPSSGTGSSSGSAPPRISGGDQLFVDSAAGPYLTFAAELDEDGATQYGLSGTATDPLPADARLTIPGDAFPALTDYPLPDEPPVPVRISPDDSLVPIANDREYRWIPGEGNDSIVIDFVAYSDANEFVDFPIVCFVEDDGAFDLPEDAFAELLSIDDTLYTDFTRVRKQIELRDDIVIFTRIAIAE